MRTKNARAMDAIESAYVADVKRCPCSVCGAPPPSEAHHPEQGLHLIGIAACKDCHGGPGYPHGWHGDKSRWRAHKMTPPKAINKTRWMVDRMRGGYSDVSVAVNFGKKLKLGPQSGPRLSSSKILPRRFG